MGPDEIHPWIMRELVDEVAKPLSIIFQRSWQSGEVPTDWKRGNSHFQEGKKDDLGNFGPVCLTSVLGKITEQILLKALLRHMENKDEAIGGNQHDFIKGKSCLTNLVAFYHVSGYTKSVMSSTQTCAKYLILSHLTY